MLSVGGHTKEFTLLGPMPARHLAEELFTSSYPDMKMLWHSFREIQRDLEGVRMVENGDKSKQKICELYKVIGFTLVSFRFSRYRCPSPIISIPNIIIIVILLNS